MNPPSDDTNAEDAIANDAHAARLRNGQHRLVGLIHVAVSANIDAFRMVVHPHMVTIRFSKDGEFYSQTACFPRIARDMAGFAFREKTDDSTVHFNPLVPHKASLVLTVDGEPVHLLVTSAPMRDGLGFEMDVRLCVADDDVPF